MIEKQSRSIQLDHLACGGFIRFLWHTLSSGRIDDKQILQSVRHVEEHKQ